MKKIINKLSYDTEKAEFIADFNNRLPVSDFCHLRETLYKTKKGRFFVHGEGGASTWCAVGNVSTGRWGGEKIRALTGEEAADWVQEREIVDLDVLNLFNFEDA